ncbi:hypothetical protein [Methylobacterium sp. CG08_land_8_20_14_0_20_71_15]|uniref:hypothetical protein n=1 Tax=Methylobacterium sp. CG08_land_8_20_14_0_20_71_15 TaxID=1975531 RepID=UPI000CC7A718|nr:hypothetical protein [Methylobacterium sp. CG08_land_8_20_14_0_20_71_15]PIU11873.1 MAG: hypothetical protein COT28_17905 [Methylobacterium sp. CG08_land_8_20_14_0_20_71_15]
MARGRFFFGFLLSIASALGITWLVRRIRHQAKVELYFDDGSMLALNNKSSELSRKLTAMGDELVRKAL